ncbi:hypothetical protein WDW86_13915 [Bdellovibrionota bacterium FG-2]
MELTRSLTKTCLGVCAILSALFSLAAHALPIHETFFVQGVPGSATLDSWSALPGTRSYTFQFTTPYPEDLNLISQIKGADHIQIEIEVYPMAQDMMGWKKLADQGVELIALNTGLPTPSEIEMLNTIGFSKLIIIMTGFPTEAQAAQLAKLQIPVSLTMVTSMYPRLIERPSLLAIPSSVPLTFVTDYWPWYVHMDVLNMLPHAKRLRVRGMMPPEQELPYLRNIKPLLGAVVETTYDVPDAETWKRLSGIPTTWALTQVVPSQEALKAFATIGESRRISIDQDWQITPEERTRLEKSGVPVEWIHTPPYSFGYSFGNSLHD